VLSELLYVLDRLATSDRTRVELDVVTGASAGAMTTALVARATMLDPGARALLHRAWVDEIDIRHLLREPASNALLSRATVERIARECLTTPVARRPAPWAPDVLYLSVMLANMTGIDYELEDRLAQRGRFINTFHADRRRFRLGERAPAIDPATGRPDLDLDTREPRRVNTVDDPETWVRLRDAAVASGSFPLAFPPVMLPTDRAELFGSAMREPPARFCYVDGGLFNNEPIREAVQLALEADGGELEPDRIFVLVDANLNRSSVRLDLDDRLALLPAAGRLLAMVRGEAGANDWVRALRVNNELEWRDLMLESLADVVRGKTLADPAGFLTGLKHTADSIVERKHALFPDRYSPDAENVSYLDRSLARTREQFAPWFEGLDELRRDILAHLIFVLNSVAGLDKKARLDLSVIYADPDTTAGDRLFSFGGFFEREWREHDFRVGRRKARELLPQILDYGGVDVPPERDPALADLYAIDVDLSRVTMTAVDRRLREAMRDAVLDKAGAAARAEASNRIEGWLAAFGARRLLKPRLTRLLEL
jgi:predicted acylesterase/phospholipase RssA